MMVKTKLAHNKFANYFYDLMSIHTYYVNQISLRHCSSSLDSCSQSNSVCLIMIDSNNLINVAFLVIPCV